VHTLAGLDLDMWRLVNVTEVLRDWRLPSSVDQPWPGR